VGGREDLVTALKAIMVEKHEGLGEAPTPEELLAYRDGLLDEPARQKLEAKLAIFPDATRALADLAAFPDVEPAPGTQDLTEEEVAASWEEFRKRLRPHPPAPSPAPPEHALPGRGGAVKVLPSRRWNLAAAASIALVVGAVGGFFVGRAVKTAPDSAVNVAIAELAPVGEGEERAAAPEVALPSGSEELLLVLSLPPEAGISDCRAEILDAAGKRVWSREGLHPTSLGTIQLSFRRGALTPGFYRLPLFAREAGGERRLALYELRLVEE
jgi:hypothetical protein